jgi:hypothetical protein
MPEAELERIIGRAGLKKEAVDLHPFAFCDRLADVHLPVEAAEALARAFAAAEPEMVLMCIEDQEELKLRGNAPGERYLHDLLRQDAPGFALARQWAGFEREVEQLQQEIRRLRQLLSMAAYDLDAAGEEWKARRLRRALEGR